MIPKDIARCNQHLCKLRENCKRYKQLTIDFHNRDTKDKHIIVTKFEGDEVDDFGFVTKCSNQIPIY